MINLLPYKEKKSIERIRSIRLARTVIFGLTFMSLSSLALFLPTVVAIKSRSSIIMKQISDLQKKGMVVNDVDLDSLKRRALTSQIKLTSPKVIQPTEYIEIIKSVDSRGISIDNFALSATNELKISGIADTREILQSFIKNLENNQKIALVNSPVSNFVKNKNSDFNITISFK